MIPKIFHRVWVSGTPVPDYFHKWGEGWLKLHPEWKMKLWTERDIKDFESYKLFDKCSSFAQQSDLVRYEAVFREGGVYLDTDMECVKNIEPLIGDFKFFCCWQKPGMISNAIFGSTAGHPVAEELFKRSQSEFKPDPWNAMGPPFFTPIILASDGATIFRRKTFIPYTRDEYSAFKKYPMEGLEPPSESYAINHRSSVWNESSTRRLTPEWIGLLREAMETVERAEYWHYRFEFSWGATTPGKPGWAERVEKRRRHFFDPLLEFYGGSLKGKRVLDLACCQGYWSFLARRSGAESTLGIDASEAFIREAKAVQTIVGPAGCSFVQANLEEAPWWEKAGEPREVTFILGSLYHFTDPVYVLRKAMSMTKETIVIDGEVEVGDEPTISLRPRTPGEPTTMKSGMTSDLRAVCTPKAIEWILRDGGFNTIRRLEPSKEMPVDYHDGRTMSFIATRS